MKLKFALTLFLLLLAFPVLADKPLAPDSVPGTTFVNAEQALELILADPRMAIIDSRHAEEYAKGHIEGAINMLDNDTSAKSLARHVRNKNAPMLLYCNGDRCMRSSNAAKIAVDAGYKKIYWFRGGWAEWIEKKMPIEQ